MHGFWNQGKGISKYCHHDFSDLICSIRYPLRVVKQSDAATQRPFADLRLIQIVAVTYFLLIPPDTLEGYYYRCIFLGFCARVLGRVDYEQCRTVWHQYPGNGGNLYSESDQGYYHPCNPDFLHAGKIIWADHHWSDNWVFFNWYLYHQYFLVER